MKNLIFAFTIMTSFSGSTFASTGELYCGPVALNRADASEFQRLQSVLITIPVDSSTHEFSIQKEFTAVDFKDAKFDGRILVNVKGQKLGDNYPDALKGKMILTLSYAHYTFDVNGNKVAHASGYSQGNAFEPLTGNSDGDDPILKGIGATCMFFSKAAPTSK